MTSCRICVSVFEKVEADNMTRSLPLHILLSCCFFVFFLFFFLFVFFFFFFLFFFFNFKGTAVRQVTIMNHLNMKQLWAVDMYKTQDKIFRRKRLSSGANFVHVYIEIWGKSILKFNKFSMQHVKLNNYVIL